MSELVPVERKTGADDIIGFVWDRAAALIQFVTEQSKNGLADFEGFLALRFTHSVLHQEAMCAETED